MKERNQMHDFHQRVSLYFDNALSEEDQRDLMNLVNNDPRCSKVFNKEKSFREFIKTNVKRPQVSSDFIQAIRDKIRVV